MKRALRAFHWAMAMLLLTGTPARAHRLDEYLQGAILSVEKSRLDAEITLTPGVAVFPSLLASIDRDGNGAISAIEQQQYAGRVLNDLSLRIDGQRLTPHLRAMRFSGLEDMKEGRGEIQIEFDAALPGGGLKRTLVLENHHQSGIAAYQVNCLAPRDPAIRIIAQHRNYSQSFYQLEYEQAGSAQPAAFASLTGNREAAGMFSLLLFASLAASLALRRAWYARK